MKLCPDCISGVVLPGTPGGKMVKIGAIDVYLASPPPEARAKAADKSAVVLFTDVFGLPLGNPKVMADSFAKELGLDVWVPDMFNGKPPIKNEDIMPYDHQDLGSPWPWWKFAGFIWNMAWTAPSMFIGSNSQKKVFARMRVFVETLKKEKGIQKVGAVGYCYGGAAILSLIPYHVLASAVICHPGGFDPKQVDHIDFPTSWVTCEEDFVMGPKLADAAEAQFAARAARAKQADEPVPPAYEFRRYMGTRHGFACRPAQTTEWFKKTLL
ncbi:hypothetical protein CALCODRAFT_498548 [Calocera cornea HHB12733]|uniref:Dienelactone hydrolase domain-containing protein n=1 Tax=Calocera cornea HHB12733 TaxID=1353952 RepID=A0A165EU65_9BASI|nr:hypothetical protein CALCODRAFT_498548 [Calocera cornea HHB12733]